MGQARQGIASPFAREVSLAPDSTVIVSAVPSADRGVAPCVVVRRFHNLAGPGQPGRWEESLALRVPASRVGALIAALQAAAVAIGAGA